MKRNTGKLYWAAIPENNNKKRRFHTAAFSVQICRFEEDISNPCRRHTETLHYSLFTLHFYHPKLRKGEKPRHTPSVPGIARESPPAGPRLSLDAVRAHSQGKCTGHMHAAGSENYAGHKNQGIPLSFGDCQGTAPRKGGHHSKAGRVPGREGFSR